MEVLMTQMNEEPGWLKLDLDAHRALEAQRVSLQESQLDILKRALLRADSAASVGSTATPMPRKQAAHSQLKPPPADWHDKFGECDRRTGHFQVQLHEYVQFADSQKAAYRLALIWLEKKYPGTLARLASHPGGRGRRIVAADQETLYTRSPELAKMAEKLTGDWYVDVNLSKEQKLSRLRTACRITGLEFGKDLVVDL
ncbi:hypothetical protein Mmar10_0450 [Maricaulis maris MCS10]|uniref:Uncharacterized protein n=2 Tax=Maricaulaceae TaxID=2800061 RepID=Q0ASJ4_MARMM|nr:hypothetical protein Mmar10_0450 [Maricaulis maris MCS10]